MIYKFQQNLKNLMRSPSTFKRESSIFLRLASVGLLLFVGATVHSPAIASKEHAARVKEDPSVNWWEDPSQPEHQLDIDDAAFPYNPPNRGAPGQTRDAGSRPVCPNPSQPFTAIAPFSNWGETTQSHPTFWLYLPYAVGDVELFLRDEQTQMEVYRVVYNIDEDDVPEGGGIRPFQLPSDAPPLEVDKVYNWQFDLVCNPETGSNYRVTGMVIRRSPSEELQTQLATTTPLETAFVYAEAGLWYDALTTVAELRQQDSTPEVNQAWIDLLEHPLVALEDLSSRPLLVN